jgi:hypothetical protein
MQEIGYCLQENTMNLHYKDHEGLFQKQDETHNLWGWDAALINVTACGNIVTIPL